MIKEFDKKLEKLERQYKNLASHYFNFVMYIIKNEKPYDISRYIVSYSVGDHGNKYFCFKIWVASGIESCDIYNNLGDRLPIHFNEKQATTIWNKLKELEII